MSAGVRTGRAGGPLTRRAMRAAAVALMCGAGLATIGCAAGPATPAETPTQFVDREPLASCGDVTLAVDEEIPAENLACLEAAGAAGAELAVTRPTTEGDPVTEYYRVLPGGGWEAYIDGSKDTHGGLWWYTDCPEAETIADLAACQGVQL